MKILDWYILKKYLSTFITIQLLFIPIAIVVNLADNIDKILANEVPFNLVACLLYTSPSPRDKRQSRMPSSA